MRSERLWLLSGGIGSGKSTVREMLAAAGVLTIDADAVGHEVLQDQARALVGRRWPQVVTADGVDRAALARVVFSDPGALAELEQITHPHIFGRIRAEVEAAGEPVVVEIPVLTGALEGKRIVVDARDTLRLERAVARGMDRDEVRRRMKAQPTRAEWLAAADVVVPNHGGIEALGATVRTLADLIVVPPRSGGTGAGER